MVNGSYGLTILYGHVIGPNSQFIIHSMSLNIIIIFGFCFVSFSYLDCFCVFVFFLPSTHTQSTLAWQQQLKKYINLHVCICL